MLCEQRTVFRLLLKYHLYVTETPEFVDAVTLISGASPLKMLNVVWEAVTVRVQTVTS